MGRGCDARCPGPGGRGNGGPVVRGSSTNMSKAEKMTNDGKRSNADKLPIAID